MKLKALPILLALYAPVHAEVRISEFLASNNAIAVPGQAGSGFHDWIELENTGPDEVDIAGWGLTDDAASPMKWTFPSGTTIPGNSFLVVLANSNNTPDGNGILQTNFSLSVNGEFVGLSDEVGVVVSQFGANRGGLPSAEPEYFLRDQSHRWCDGIFSNTHSGHCEFRWICCDECHRSFG